VPTSNSKALAAAIKIAIKDKEARCELENNAYKKAEEHDWGNIAKKYLDLYERIISNRK